MTEGPSKPIDVLPSFDGLSTINRVVSDATFADYSAVAAGIQGLVKVTEVVGPNSRFYSKSKEGMLTTKDGQRVIAITASPENLELLQTGVRSIKEERRSQAGTGD